MWLKRLGELGGVRIGRDVVCFGLQPTIGVLRDGGDWGAVANGALAEQSEFTMETQGRKLYRVRLTDEERVSLAALADGDGAAYKRRHANILLHADEDQEKGGLPDHEIASLLRVGRATVERVRKRCVLEGLEAALERRKQVNRKPRKLDGAAEAQLVALACSDPPEGRARWTLKLLGERLVELEIVDSISEETVRRTLKKTM